MHIKIAFYLDDLTRETGALRVIPGSHILDDVYASRVTQLVGTGGADGSLLPATAVETKPGDVVVFNHNCKHASFGGGGKRRMFTMNLCQRYPQEKLGDLRAYLEGIARFLVDRPYGEIMIATAGPERSGCSAPRMLLVVLRRPACLMAHLVVSTVQDRYVAWMPTDRRVCAERWLQQVMENDGHLAALARSHREQMDAPSRG